MDRLDGYPDTWETTRIKASNLQFVQRLAWAAVVAIMVVYAWLVPLDSAANQQVDAGLKRALLSFASARAPNAIISAVQGTEVAVEPAGIGVIFTAGQVLDPVNDLIEQFSDLMLIASVSFGIQKVLISIGSYWMVSLLLSLALAGWAFFYLRMQSVSGWLTRLLVVLLRARFAVRWWRSEARNCSRNSWPPTIRQASRSSI